MGGRSSIWGSKFGTTFDAGQWLSLNPCGCFGVSCSLFIHLYALVVIYVYLTSNSLFAQTVFCVLYVPACTLAIASLVMALTTDPGAVPMGARPLVTVKRAGSQNEETKDSNCDGDGNLTNSNDGNMNNDSLSSISNNSAATTSSGNRRRMRQRERALRRCCKCNNNFKPSRAHHDSVTGRCIVKFDHFCPWVGNAIGALNHKFFVLFNFYTMWTTLLSLILLIVRAVHCGYYVPDSSDEASRDPFGTGEGGGPTYKKKEEHDADPYLHNRILLGDFNIIASAAQYYGEECKYLYSSKALLVLLAVSVVFFIFTCCMLCEQVEAIQTNTGKIARMKMRVGQAGTELARVTEEFNEMFGGDSPHVSWHWFVPIPVRFPRGMRKVVLGYEWDQSFEPVPYEQPSNGDAAPGQASGSAPLQSSLVEVVPELASKPAPEVDPELGNVKATKPNLSEDTRSDKMASKVEPNGIKKRANGRGGVSELELRGIKKSTG